MNIWLQLQKTTRAIYRGINHILRRFFILLIQVYRLLVSPVIGQHCRFYPSCSQYAQEAIEQRGLFMGSYLAIRRILRCNPWGKGGFDPVPGNPCTNVTSSCCNNKITVK